MEQKTYIVGGIGLPPSKGEAVVFEIAEKKLKSIGLCSSDPSFAIYKRSVDARKKNDIKFVYSVAVTGDFSSVSQEKLKAAGISLQKEGKPSVIYGKQRLLARPIVIGAGPAGLFAALLLAENGYKPLVLERGGSVDDRLKAVNAFREKRILSTTDNIQFGAGGAGTFSDGKLVTRVSDPLSAYVLDTFCRFGAPKEIKFLAKPHIGTDYLQTVVSGMVSEVERLGGEVRFHTRVDGFVRRGNTVTAVVTENGEIECGAVVVAVGNSARDTFSSLIRDGYRVIAKPFSVGLRIEHLQKDIDFAMHGEFFEGHGLPHAEYALSYNTKSRGVYTFCMCPGGEVVAAASEEGGVVVNGMSRHARDGKNANSAVVVSVFKEDFGDDPLKAMALQREIEHKAFLAGGSDYATPLCTVGDFLSDSYRSLPSRIEPTYMGGNAYKIASPELFLPKFVTSSLRDGIGAFDRSVTGFSVSDALLSGAETRTSSPIRLLRTDKRTADGVDNMYPCGEGAGYAGGITSAALDGIHTAEAMMAVYSPLL